MNLQVGLVGLPNVGKSTTFNALTKTQNAEAQNYPFCTIEPNIATVPVPDKRLYELAKIVNPEKVLHSTIDFIDIAGLVRGASKGEGLGNQFLANIREVQLILHIVRCFEDGNITHVDNSIDSIRDIKTIELELIFSDISTAEKKIDKLKKQKHDKTSAPKIELLEELLKHLDNQNMAISFSKKNEDLFLELDKELNFLTNKKIIYIANVDEEHIKEDNIHSKALKEHASKNNSTVIKLCSKLEESFIDLSEEEKLEYLEMLGVEESGLENVIKTSFKELSLINYFTAGVKEVRSWTIEKGTKAPKAAGAIHTDFEKGFIKADTISYDDYIKYGGESKAKEAGALSMEGKDYVVNDGDVMHFKFNV